MTKQQTQVFEFHKVFGCTVNVKPTVPDLRDKQIRVKLIAEELSELSTAFESQNVVDIADALGDFLYVVLGSAVCCGIDLEPVFEEIHRSNMTKLWTLDEINSGVAPGGITVNAVRTLSPLETNVRAFRVIRNDGKVLKSPSYERARLEEIVK